MAAPNTNPADRATDAALRQVLRATSPAGCDVELAAAYAEGRLRGAERLRVESHLADCASCRRVATELLAERAPEEPAPEPAPVRAWWRWQWAVPALAGLLIVGSVVFYQREQVLRRNAPPASARQIAQVDHAFTPAAPAPEVLENKPVQPPPEVGPRRAARPATPVAPPPVAAEEFRSLEGGRAAQTARLNEAEQLKDRREVAAAGPANAVSSVAPPPPPALPQPAPAAVGGVVQAERDAVVRGQEAPAQDKEKAIALLARRADEPLSPLPEGVPTRATARDGQRLWAVSDGGRIFRSTDAGRTWTRLPSPTTADLVAVRWDPQARTLTVRDRDGREYHVEP